MQPKLSRTWWKSIAFTGVLALLLLLIGTALAQAPGGDGPGSALTIVPLEAFTYQGRLLDAGQPANGVYDFRFTLRGPKEGPVGTPQLIDDVSVSNGLFTVYLQPGALNTLFTGTSVWLQIEVRPGNSTGAYTQLLPWQPITPAPYAAGLVPGTVVRGGVASPSAVISVTQTSYGAFAIYGSASATGIYGRGDDTGVTGFGSAYGVHGESGNTGVYGRSAGSGYGVYGYSSQGTGVSGSSTSSEGVYGGSNAGVGVFGYSNSGVGISAMSSSNNPLEAWSSANRRFYVSNVGNVYADGTFNPGGADFAEMLPAQSNLGPGDVLVINAESKLARSTHAYQTNVAGVYSANPGFLGGASDDTELSNRAPLAVVGVVPVKVTTENGSIQPGDLLTTSSLPGHAMKADPITVNGMTFYSSGAIIGKALEALESRTGVIKVLIVLQ